MGENMTKSVEIRNKILGILKDDREMTTMEVADLAGLTMPITRYYLRTLAFEGKITWRRLGARVLTWRLKKQ